MSEFESFGELESFGFDREDVGSGSIFEKYKGKKSETHRLSIIYNDPKHMVTGGRTHFKEKFFFCQKSKGNSKCCEICGPSRWRVGCVVIKYGTDRLGNLKKPMTYELLPWIFGEANYGKMKTIHSEFSLATHDIKVSCTNEEYQHLNIALCNESIWTAKETFKKTILEEAKPIWESLKRSIASNLSTEELNEILGISTTVSTDPTTKLDLDSVLDTI